MKRISLTAWILIALVAGIAFGAGFPEAAKPLGLLGTVFLRLIKSIIAPLLFGTLVVGIAGTGSAKTMGRIGGKAILYFEIVTTVALFVGLGFANLVKPGAGVQLQAGAPGVSGSALTLAGILEHAFPASIIDAMAKGEVLQIVVFTFLFGTACVALGHKAEPVVRFCEALSEIMFRYTDYVMYAAEIFFVVVVFGSVMAIARIPVRRFIRHVRAPFLLAYSTASSEAALPSALENMEKMGAPKHIVAFVLPAGYSFNLDGSTLYLTLAAMFIAQAANVSLPFTTQLMMMLTLMLTSKGLAGVPRAALVVLAGTLPTFHLPVEGIAVLLAVDTLMDMCRTSVNVLGNCLATVVVARWEGVALPDGPAEVEAVGEAA